MVVKKQGGGAGLPKDVFAWQQDKRKATVKPVARVADLKGLWQREYAVYRACIVQVTGRKGAKLTFRFVNTDGTVQEKTFSVDLDDGGSVQSDLPSTAPLVTPGSRNTIGYLFLTEAWIATNVRASGPPSTQRRAAVAAPTAEMVMGPKNPPMESL
jgi:hypothetical protein